LKSYYATIEFVGPENKGLAYLFKSVSWLEAEISQNTYFMAAMLKIQNGGLNDVGANANINFWIPHPLLIPKMYRFANLQKFWTKIHSEPDYKHYMLRFQQTHKTHSSYRLLVLNHPLFPKWWLYALDKTYLEKEHSMSVSHMFYVYQVCHGIGRCVKDGSCSSSSLKWKSTDSINGISYYLNKC